MSANMRSAMATGLLLLAASAALPPPARAQSCNAQMNLFDNVLGAADPAVPGLTVRRIRIELGAGSLSGGSPPALDVQKLRFNLACRDAPFFSVPCVADDSAVSFQGNVSSANCVDTMGNPIPASAFTADTSVANLVTFVPSATVRIPAQTAPSDTSCRVEFDVKIEAASTDATPDAIGFLAFYASGDALCTNGHFSQAVQSGLINVVAGTPVPTSTPTPTSSAATATLTATVQPSQTPTTGGGPTTTPTPPCVGDCNAHHDVTVDELLTMVSIALGQADLTSCMVGDSNGDKQITVDEILTAVSNALNGC